MALTPLRYLSRMLSQGIKGTLCRDYPARDFWESLKKCPGCRSMSSDAETKCGVCGESLEGVPPRLVLMRWMCVPTAMRPETRDPAASSLEFSSGPGDT